jgi:hypothetical protein
MYEVVRGVVPPAELRALPFVARLPRSLMDYSLMPPAVMSGIAPAEPLDRVANTVIPQLGEPAPSPTLGEYLRLKANYLQRKRALAGRQ